MKRKEFLKKFDEINKKYSVKLEKKDEKKIYALLNTCFVMGGQTKALKFLEEYENSLINKIKGGC